ncbi:MAG: C25 family cysteine peptidase [Candidatus Thermoplasmatota archaeon]|nr:C25 family cysteine peptidase [Candidatus Thermoplasmatota archaeon]
MRPHTVCSLAILIIIAQAGIASSFVQDDDPAPSRSEMASPDIEYLIVTTSALEEAFIPLKEWKMRLGFQTRVHLLDGPEGILETGQGRDDAEKLFDHISTVYEESGSNLTYLLLGGDAEIVPYRYLHAGSGRFGLDEEYLSDVYYSSPGFEWDPDGDGLYGELEDITASGSENLTFPLIVGRVPATTPEEAERYVERAIRYESNPPAGDWIKKAIFASSLMDRPNVLDDPSTSEDEGYNPDTDNGYIAIQRLRQFIPYTMELDEFHDYDRYWGENYTIENDTLSISTLPDAISGGASVVAFAGQSFYDADVWNPPTAYSLAQWFDPTGTANGSLGFQPALSSEDLPGLDNGDMLPVAYFSSCDSANFSDPDDADLSNLVIAPSGGAICLIGSTGVSWRGEYDLIEGGFGNWYLMSAFWERYFLSGGPARSMYEVKGRYLNSFFGFEVLSERVLSGIYTYNYFGDPSVSGWTSAPRELRVAPDRSGIFAGGDDVLVTVTLPAGSPVYNARVSIFMNGTDEAFTGFTDDNGQVTISTRFVSEGEASVTASKWGYLPRIGYLEVYPRPPDVSIIPSSLEITSNATESKPFHVKVSLMSEGGSHDSTVTVGLFPGALDDHLSWPDAISESTVVLLPGSTAEVLFNISEPDPIWKVLSIGVRPLEGEIDLVDNILTFPVSVNSRPVVLSRTVVLSEDTSRYYDLTDALFDPDTIVDALSISLGAGSPEWITLSSKRFLFIEPPENWSGELDLLIIVSDGLETAHGYIRVSVTPVNDEPVLRSIEQVIQCFANSPMLFYLDPYDAEGEAVTISIEEGPDFVSVSVHSLRFMASELDVGMHALIVNASDPSGGYNTYNISVEVLPVQNDLYFMEPSLYLTPAMIGRHYSYGIKLGGSLSGNASFSDNSTLFDIDPISGVIEFKPEKADRGEHWIRITATSGNFSISRSFILRVEKDEGGPNLMTWLLIGSIAILSVLVIAVYLWGGRRLEEYGLEE